MSAFNGPRLKIERGKRHIEELRGEVSRFLAEQPYRLVVEADTDPAFQRLVLDNVTAFPKEIPLILGDAIHNLRAALDHLACILVRENGQPDNDVYFPVVKNAAALPARLHSAKIDRAAADVVGMVRALTLILGETIISQVFIISTLLISTDCLLLLGTLFRIRVRSHRSSYAGLQLP
jgi:hypothetical protein